MLQNHEPTKVRALDLGAGDFVTKPFGMAELNARVRVLLRRTAPPLESETGIEVGDFKIDPQQRRVEVEGKAVHLTPKEFELIQFFVANRGKVLTHRAILSAVWAGECGAAGVSTCFYWQLTQEAGSRSTCAQIPENRAVNRLPL